jgi:DNA-binding response OmpR family regulator
MPRVLVVDDQSDVRAMIGIVLRIHHFETVEADSAAAGLKAFEQFGFDLAIVDVFLHGSSGIELIEKMRERNPELPVVAISGMTTLDFVAESPDLSDVVCLQKPFRPNELMRAIEAVRAKHGASSGAAVA